VWTILGKLAAAVFVSSANALFIYAFPQEKKNNNLMEVFLQIVVVVQWRQAFYALSRRAFGNYSNFHKKLSLQHNFRRSSTTFSVRAAEKLNIVARYRKK